jgi:uncharacterized ferritin-like protein (DUF455 family)
MDVTMWILAMTSMRHSDSGNLFWRASECLREADPMAKCQLTEELVQALHDNELSLDTQSLPEAPFEPGRPVQPLLVPPRDLPRRRLSSDHGRASLLHALAHIEFNAISLALDAVVRFRGLPVRYYRDWSAVAGEEAQHFRLLCGRLHDLGHAYGDFPAHNGLWQMAMQTRHNPLHRMALVPRVLEARGLDVTPAMIQRFETVQDQASAEVLRIILRDEIGHVRVGTRWYRYLCGQWDLDPDKTFLELVRQYMQGGVRGPFNRSARSSAGFTAAELDRLEELAASTQRG